MKLKFEANQPFQLDAISAITDVFEDLPQGSNQLDIQLTSSNDQQTFLQTELGVGNFLTLPEEDILKNLQKIQKRNDLRIATSLENGEYTFPNFTVEMETGTGKTYVYLRTIFELNQKYGYKKFVIVVPSLAVREGVLKNIEITQEHFKNLYNINFDKFVYNSKKPGLTRKFATSNDVQIMIMNIQAFQKDVDSVEEERSSTLFHRESDRLSGRSPKEFVQATNPIVIIDEPQSVDNTPKARKAVKSLNPLFVLRYSATHRENYNLVYRLDPVKAYELGLVKQISVASVVDMGYTGEAYVKVENIDNRSGLKAKLKIHVDSSNGPKPKDVSVKSGSNLFVLSGEREIYRNGYIVDEITINEDLKSGYIKFNDGKRVDWGQEVGGLNDEVKRVQIKETIKQHFDKEKQLRERGIKVLSLFFVDRVANYRIYNESGQPQKGKYAKWFEEAYTELVNNEGYLEFKTDDIGKLHNGYFSEDRQGKLKDSTGKAEDDVTVYDKIMKDKETLLSLTEPLKFIFSHSALREGWDNPNVFQICTLNETNSEMKKRQEIGRGLRIPVNQEGERVFDTSINKLVVLANESYEDFVKSLQTDYEEEGVEFGVVKKSLFASLEINEEEIGAESSEKIWEALRSNGFLDDKGKLTEKFINEKGKIAENLPEEFKALVLNVIDCLKRYNIREYVKNDSKKRPLRLNKEVYLNPEFEKLWKKISSKTVFSVEYKTEPLIQKTSEVIKNMPKVERPKILLSRAEIDIDDAGVSGRETHNKLIEVDSFSNLPDLLSYIQKETQLTRGTITKILIDSERLDEFSLNPQKFMDQIIQIIEREKNKLIVDGIVYEKLEGEEYEMRLFEQKEVIGYLSNMIASDKSIYERVPYESEVEREFAEKLNNNEDVKLFMKLPDWFKIETPIGTYNPDWALVKNDDRSTLYLVRETKGSLLEEERRGLENEKIRYGKKHFEALGVDFKDISPPFTTIN